MTSLSSLTASFPAEKRCKGKHFFSFHQNFFQVFFGEAFRGGRTAARRIPPQAGERCQPFIVQRLSLPKAGAKVRTLSDSATHSTQLFGREDEKKEKQHIYIYGRTRLHLFMRHKHGQISTRKNENFYSERCLSHAVGTGNASACIFGSEETGHKKCLFGEKKIAFSPKRTVIMCEKISEKTLFYLQLVETFAIYTYHIALRNKRIGVDIFHHLFFANTTITFTSCLLYHPCPSSKVTPRSTFVAMASAIFSYCFEKIRN